MGAAGALGIIFTHLSQSWYGGVLKNDRFILLLSVLRQ